MVTTGVVATGAEVEAGAAEDDAGGIVPEAVGRVMVTLPERQYVWANVRVSGNTALDLVWRRVHVKHTCLISRAAGRCDAGLHRGEKSSV